MTDRRHSRRDATGRFARRPVEGVDAESRFDPMGDDIPFDDVSGAPSPNTTDRPRHGPEADELACGAYGSSMGWRKPVLVHPDDRPFFNGPLRTAVRKLDPSGQGMLSHLVGLGPGTAARNRAGD